MSSNLSRPYKSAVKEYQSLPNVCTIDFDFISEDFSDLICKVNEISNNQSAIDNYNSTISKLDNDIQEITSEIAKSVGFLEELENEKDEKVRKNN